MVFAVMGNKKLKQQSNKNKKIMEAGNEISFYYCSEYKDILILFIFMLIKLKLSLMLYLLISS